MLLTCKRFACGRTKLTPGQWKGRRTGLPRCCCLLAYVNHTAVTVAAEDEPYQHILIRMSRRFEGGNREVHPSDYAVCGRPLVGISGSNPSEGGVVVCLL